jgi:D-alanine-D-alanine ligase
MKITILTHHDDPADPRLDVVVDQLAEALRQRGHTPSVLAVHDDLRQLINGLTRRKPDLVFNVMETFGDTELGAVGVAGFLDLLGVPYTGGGPGELYLQEDKALTKKLLAFDGIRYPDFAVFTPQAGLETGGTLRMPLFVKPLRMDGSFGIGPDSVVHNATDMMKRIVGIHEKVHDAALVEEFIEGREFYVGILGNHQPTVFPPIEMDFSGLPDGAPHVLGADAKWKENSAAYKGTRAKIAEVSEELKARLQKVAADAYRALRVRDYGRIDLRLTPTGDIYVIEVNANCYLEQSSEFATAAAAAGIDYPTLIDRIVQLALERRQHTEPSTRRRKKRKAVASAKAQT